MDNRFDNLVRQAVGSQQKKDSSRYASRRSENWFFYFKRDFFNRIKRLFGIKPKYVPGRATMAFSAVPQLTREVLIKSIETKKKLGKFITPFETSLIDGYRIQADGYKKKIFFGDVPLASVLREERNARRRLSGIALDKPIEGISAKVPELGTMPRDIVAVLYWEKGRNLLVEGVMYTVEDVVQYPDRVFYKLIEFGETDK